MEDSSIVSGGDVIPTKTDSIKMPDLNITTSLFSGNSMYIYIFLAVIVIAGIIYFMYNKINNDIKKDTAMVMNKKDAAMVMNKKEPENNVNATKEYFINDINGNKILVSGTLIKENENKMTKPRIIHPQKQMIDMNFEEIQMDEDDKTKIHNLTNSEINEIHQKIENIEY